MKAKRKIILNYNVIFEEQVNGGYAVWVPDLPGCASQGETLDEAKRNIEEAITLYLEDAPKDTISSTSQTTRQFFVPIRVVYG